MNAAAFEFRVLSGMQRHARCLAEDGTVVGSDASCDIVLADKGLAARAGSLRIYEHGWALVRDTAPPLTPASPDENIACAPQEAGGEPVVLSFNQPLALGPVWITVARPQDSWLNAPEAANDTVAGGMTETGRDNREPPAHPETASSAPASDMATAMPGTPAARRGMGWPAKWALGLVVPVLIVAIIIALLPARRAPAPAEDPHRAAQASIGQITSVIERLGLSSRVHVFLSPAGTVSVEGWVRNHDEQDSLAAALSQIWPRPAMRVSNEAQAIRTAQSTLDAFNILYKPRYEGNGHLEVDGITSSARERMSAMDALRARLPGLKILEGHILLASDVTHELTERLTRAGLSGVALNWQANRLEADAAALSGPRLARLQAVLEDFNAQYFDVATLAHASSHPVSDSVPFRIRSVVSGPQPFIVLDGGAKILEGGNYMGFVLEKIEPDRVIFGGIRSAIIIR